ncbi:MAG: hypothetical protein HOB22_01540 [Candidatus Marinimicrobia bacterium]|jgi:hypothetical protein|nr:hypothetical protein [Candidatus Neomarinimicrobiota bacterium]
MKKFIYNISFLLSILIISIFVLKKISDIKDSKPNSIMIINNSGITIENFSCKHVDHSISMELFANESSFEFSFISNGESHLELAWFINDSVIHKNYGYYTSGFAISDTVIINTNNEIISNNLSINSDY